MKANGYRTACIGKWHLGSRPEYAPNSRGFDYFWGFLGGCIDSYSHFYYWGGPNVHDLWRNGEEIHYEGRFFTEETLREAKEFIRAGDRRQPFLPLLGGQHPALPAATQGEVVGLLRRTARSAAHVRRVRLPRSTTTWANCARSSMRRD